jgi:hypothetical protein
MSLTTVSLVQNKEGHSSRPSPGLLLLIGLLFILPLLARSLASISISSCNSCSARATSLSMLF